eukprot:10755867-Lingulodinium_polyedra.AAC.1
MTPRPGGDGGTGACGSGAGGAGWPAASIVGESGSSRRKCQWGMVEGRGGAPAWADGGRAGGTAR